MNNLDEILAFSLEIEYAAREKSLSYIDTIIDYCENNIIELDAITHLISETLKSKIQLEAESLNFLPKSTTLKLPT